MEALKTIISVNEPRFLAIVNDLTDHQLSLLRNEKERTRQSALDSSIDVLKKRFGTYCVRPAILLADRKLLLGVIRTEIKAIADKYNSPWVCCNTCGVKRNLGIPYSEVFLSKKWRDTVALPSGIDVTALYSLRHTFGTLALKYGRDKQSVGATLGHKYESTTNVYIDIDEKMLIELQETSTNIVDQKLNEMFLLK